MALRVLSSLPKRKSRHCQKKCGLAVLTSPGVYVVMVAHELLAQVFVAALESRDMQRSR